MFLNERELAQRNLDRAIKVATMVTAMAVAVAFILAMLSMNAC